MDREIPKEQLLKERRKRIIKFSAILLACILVIYLLVSLFSNKVSLQNIQLSEVDKGTIEISVSASGKVVAAFEEIINTPIESRIVEVYKKAGDSVNVGTPLLRLDLQSIETDYKKMLDELQMRQYKIEQSRIQSQSDISNAEMQLNVKKLQIDQMEVELTNEKYLDSIGAGTTDKVHEVELRYKVAVLEYKQMQQKCENDKSIAKSARDVADLDLNIFRKTLAETKRVLDDAQIRSPRKAILSYINNQVGVRVPQGTQIAVISDLSHFKIEGEIADSYSDRIATGNKAIVKIGTEQLEGIVSSVTPLSRNGVISFSVQLNNDNHKRLRSGLKTDVYVMDAVKDNILRIANGPYYTGKGAYELFVLEGNTLIKRKVELGESNYESVEVVSGLKEGEQVVVSDMSKYKNNNKLKTNK
jgi:HlyD family secretion protein